MRIIRNGAVAEGGRGRGEEMRALSLTSVSVGQCDCEVLRVVCRVGVVALRASSSLVPP